MIEYVCERFGITGRVREAAIRAFARTSEIRYDAQIAVKANVLRAFLDEGVNESDFAGSSGYGYDDPARARYESLLSRIFGTEKTLARLSIVSGTHAIVTALAANVDSGRTLLSVTGRPYDTLRNAISDDRRSLVKEQAIRYSEVALAGDSFDLPAIAQELATENVDVIFVQRSRGYAPRPAVRVAEIERLCTFVRDWAQAEDCEPPLVLVDNCYGELVEEREPTHAGADLVMGSLIKNLGGTLAPAGGYISGRKDVVERVAARLYAPGLGDALGPSLGFGRSFIQGLFIAPLIVEQTLRGLDFAAALFEDLGFPVDPAPGAPRADIVQAIRLGDAARLLRFARGLQGALPVNARFRPEAGAVPGYTDPVVMSSGAFIGGATIELSCDAPLRAPFEVYLQGGIVTEYAYVGALFAAREVG